MTATTSERVTEYARQAVDYVRRALGLELAFDSDTLPLLDHYLRSVPGDQPAAIELVATTSGAYFGEVVRRRLGGRWDTTAEAVVDWRVVLPTGVHFSPAGFVAAAIIRAELDDLDTSLDAPPRMRPFLEQALARMAEVTVDDYYSLCGRLDTLEHVHEVLVAVAAEMLGKRGPDDPEGSDLSEEEVEAWSGAGDVAVDQAEVEAEVEAVADEGGGDEGGGDEVAARAADDLDEGDEEEDDEGDDERSAGVN